MKKLLLAVLAVVFLSSALADPIEYETIGSRNQLLTHDRDTSVRVYPQNTPYTSPTGTRYQYDLSNPGDRLRYRTDPGAQIRDKVNPRVNIDRRLGIYGGGVED